LMVWIYQFFSNASLAFLYVSNKNNMQTLLRKKQDSTKEAEQNIILWLEQKHWG